MFGHELRSKIDQLKPTVEVKSDQELVQQRSNKPQMQQKSFSANEFVWILNLTGQGYKKDKIQSKNQSKQKMGYTFKKSRWTR